MSLRVVVSGSRSRSSRRGSSLTDVSDALGRLFPTPPAPEGMGRQEAKQLLAQAIATARADGQTMRRTNRSALRSRCRCREVPSLPAVSRRTSPDGGIPDVRALTRGIPGRLPCGAAFMCGAIGGARSHLPAPSRALDLPAVDVNVVAAAALVHPPLAGRCSN